MFATSWIWNSRLLFSVTMLVLTTGAPVILQAAAQGDEPQAGIWNHNFERTWSRFDRPVGDLGAERTWVWGPAPISPGLIEPYSGAEGGQRIVQYFDKSRMEITSDSDVTQSDPWYVTNGLLVSELVTGRLQIGPNAFEERSPAQINVAGDPESASGPTYATFLSLLDAPAAETGQLLIDRLSRDGAVESDQSLTRYGIRAAYAVTVPTIDHQIAAPFWELMNQSGMVYEAGWFQEQPLFPNPFYATGYPITEAYWTTTEILGTALDVMIQCFERRCLTYTPSHPPSWQVEAGNVGRHYYQWRYGSAAPVEAPSAIQAPTIVLDPGHDRSTGGALGIEYVDTTRLALATRTALEDAGYIVYLTRPDVDTVLFDDPDLMPDNASSMPFDYIEGFVHTSKAVAFNPDLYISLHFNGSSNPQQAGLTIYFSSTGGEQNEQFARLVRDEMLAAIRMIGYEPPYAEYSLDTSAGKSYGGFATLGNVYSAPGVWETNRLAGIPAVLIEPLFETNPTERALIASDGTISAISQSLVNSVDRWFEHSTEDAISPFTAH